MNKIILIGNLTKDPDLSYTKDDIAVCRFNIAVNSKKGSEKVVDFFNIITWRGQAENIKKYCKKGSKIAVTGELKVESYEDRDGNERTAVKINAQEIEFLSSNKNSIENEAENTVQEEPKKAILEPVEDDDIPF